MYNDSEESISDEISSDEISSDKISSDEISSDEISSDEISSDEISLEPSEEVRTEESDEENNINYESFPELVIEVESDDQDEFIPPKTNLLDHIKSKSSLIFLLSFIFIISSAIILITLTLLNNDNHDRRFWYNQLSKYILLVLIQYGMALLVIYKNVKVNYTRKVVHISYFILPQLLDNFILHFEKDQYTEFWTCWIIFFLLFLIAKPFRSRFKFIDTLFKAVNRPEDVPYTLIWFSTQIVSTLSVIIPFSIYFYHIGHPEWIYIPILINGLADGLAEPVGVKYGKHKYEVKALGSDRIYTRSYEGSACVYIVSLIIVGVFFKVFTINQFVFNIICIPLFSTIIEAISPHTWDNPIINLLVCIFLVFSNLI